MPTRRSGGSCSGSPAGRRPGLGRRAPPRRGRPRCHDPACVLPAGAWADRGAAGAVPGEPADRHPPAALRRRRAPRPRPRPVRQRAAGGHGRVEERLHRSGRRAGQGAVPHRPGPEEPGAAAGGGALRRGHRAGGDDDPPGRRGDAVPAVQPGPRRRHGQSGQPDGSPTAYLWERVWQRDAWLDLLARFVHVEQAPKGSKARPGHHLPPLPPVGRRAGLEAAARSRGRRAVSTWSSTRPGRGSRTRSPGWPTGCRTCTTPHDTKVFDKVVVITDRGCSTGSCRTPIYQFEHDPRRGRRRSTRTPRSWPRRWPASRPGSSSPRSRSSRSCCDKVDRPARPPLRRDRGRGPLVPDRRGGQGPQAGPRWLGVTRGGVDSRRGGGPGPDRRGGRPGRGGAGRGGRRPGAAAEPVSFFAFTATPKGKTLELFGRLNPATGKHEPFHLYSMRQAIEEGFILDVLANYITYETYWNLEKAVADDPAYETEEGPGGHRPVRVAARAQPGPEGGGRSSSTSGPMSPGGSRAGPRRWWSPVAAPRRAVQAGARQYCREHGYDLGVLVASPARSLDGGEHRTPRPT